MIGVATAGEESRSLGAALVTVALGGAALFALLAGLMRWVLPLLHSLARSPDLLLLFAIAWGSRSRRRARRSGSAPRSGRSRGSRSPQRRTARPSARGS